MFFNKTTQSCHYRLGELFQTRSIQKSVCQNRPHFGRSTKRRAFRRHSRKSRRWVIEKYFKSDNNRKWVFKDTLTTNDDKKDFILKKMADIPIIRHVKIKKEANPFDPQWDAYFDRRNRKNSKALSA